MISGKPASYYGGNVPLRMVKAFFLETLHGIIGGTETQFGSPMSDCQLTDSQKRSCQPGRDSSDHHCRQSAVVWP